MRESLLGFLGSSPHVRGARLGHCCVVVHRGIIPACAGSTVQSQHIISRTEDHPRMCGEHKSLMFDKSTVPGSSPHVRGALGPAIDAQNGGGIIPACAGSTRPHLFSKLPSQDHPRMCGEHRSSASEQRDTTESSPHVRGALQVGVVAIGDAVNHPRMCGEHLSDSYRRVLDHESSPHVRGAPTFCLGALYALGIIPACAGSTGRPSWASSTPPNHPRMCGEHAPSSTSTACSTESSPHVRGAH